MEQGMWQRLAHFLNVIYKGRDHSQEGPTPEEFLFVLHGGGSQHSLDPCCLPGSNEVLCIWYLI